MSDRVLLWQIFVNLAFFTNFFGVNCQLQTEAEFKLIEALFASYPLGNGGRPVENYAQIVNVTLTLNPIHLSEVNDVEQTVSMLAELKLQWRDPFLNWSQMTPSASFNGIKRITLKRDLIWTPQIIHVNNADNQQVVAKFGEKTSVVVDSNGNVQWSPTGIFVSTFAAKLRKFPFDQQTFSLDFESWLDNGQVRFAEAKFAKSDLSKFVSVWTLNGYSVNLQTDKRYNLASFQFSISRNQNFCMFNIIIPCIFLSILQLATFGLQIEEPDRPAYSVTVLLAFGIFQLMIKEEIPKTSELVLLLLYVIVEFAIGTICTLYSSVLCYIVSSTTFKNSKIHPGSARDMANSVDVAVVKAEALVRKLRRIDTAVFFLLLAATFGVHVGIFAYLTQ